MLFRWHIAFWYSGAFVSNNVVHTPLEVRSSNFCGCFNYLGSVSHVSIHRLNGMKRGLDKNGALLMQTLFKCMHTRRPSSSFQTTAVGSDELDTNSKHTTTGLCYTFERRKTTTVYIAFNVNMGAVYSRRKKRDTHNFI